MRIGVIINPIAGRRGSLSGEAQRRQAFVELALHKAGVEGDVRLTAGPGHARTLAERCIADGCTRVVAMGGDGTVNEVAQALVGGEVPLGVLPCGSGDGLARGLGVPADLARAMDVVVRGSTRAIDVGFVGDHLFLNVAGFGFDAAVGQVFATRKTRGAWGYVSTAFRLVWRYVPTRYRVEADGVVFEGRKFLIVFANAPEYGNGAVLAPDADMSDGRLDVGLVDGDGGAWAQIWRARRLYWRQGAPARGLDRLRVERARLEADELVYHVDGEVRVARGAVEVTVRPRALRVCVI
jgi:YegS/Rv2252/BmrU family lipid kinase